MQNKPYKLSLLAQEHLIKIKAYTVENYTELQWRKYQAMLISGFQTLANHPGLGKKCDDIFINGFYFPVGKHNAYYINADRFILIVAVLGQAQLPQNHIR